MTRWTGKLIGALLGYLILGPFGILVGLFLGHQFDRKAADNILEPASGGDVVLERAYRMLEVASSASNEDVAKAYRRQLSQHHPDKLQAKGASDAMLKQAKERTQRIIEAYELIRERRGMT